MKMGYGDLLRNPSAQIRSQDRQQDYINLETEAADELRASQITFKFVVFKPSVHANVQHMPKRIYF
jgi:hypothetical protein